jgi:hypothetical protein
MHTTLPSAPPPTDAGAWSWSFTWFRPVLALLSVLTTPAGIFSGLIVAAETTTHPQAQMRTAWG